MMKSYRSHIAICILWISLSGHAMYRTVTRQVNQPLLPPVLPAAPQPVPPSVQDSMTKETYAILTDRSIYISGETIRFGVFNLSSEAVRSLPWSNVLHVELITPSGTSLAREKISINRSGGKGSVTIPRDISSGTYYLKAYSSWMRNCGPESFSYLTLQIIDPFRESVLEVDTTGNFTVQPGLPPDMDQGHMSNGRLDCVLLKDHYGPGEEVQVEVAWNGLSDAVKLSASVSKKGTHGIQHVSRGDCRIYRPDRVEFIPESRGVALTGTVVNGPAGKPVPYSMIYVSILGAERNFFCNYSDSAGRFFFAFPGYTGQQDLFISAYHEEYEDLKLLIDQDFSNGTIRLPSYPILLNDSARILATELSIHAQVAQQYAPVSENGMADPAQMNTHHEKTTRDPEYEGGDTAHFRGFFYGHPSAAIRFDDFIRLPTLEEYFNEVIPQVTLRKNSGVKQLAVLGAHPDLKVYRPLVMIDGVAIFDLKSLLAVSPRLVDRIEIVAAPYVRGDVTFGGIIHVITREENLGYIDLPSSGLLVDYQMSAGPVSGQGPEPPADAHLPDLRNTLYWNSSMELSPGEKNRFSFYASDVKGNYEILIRGYDTSGSYIEKRVPFTVE